MHLIETTVNYSFLTWLKILLSGQLEMVGGGWSMNDEGATHYAAIIDQVSHQLIS
jgi:Glycosyl hydrolases family 38 N-terminal domain